MIGSAWTSADRVIVVQHAGYAAAAIDVEQAGGSGRLEVVLERTRPLRVHVQDMSGQPLSGAAVLAYAGPGDANAILNGPVAIPDITLFPEHSRCCCARSNGEGNVELALPTGTFTVCAYRSAYFMVELPEHQRQSVGEETPPGDQVAPVVVRMAELRAAVLDCSAVAGGPIISSVNRFESPDGGWRSASNLFAYAAAEKSRRELATPYGHVAFVVPCFPVDPGQESQEPEVVFRVLASGLGWVEQRLALRPIRASAPVLLTAKASEAQELGSLVVYYDGSVPHDELWDYVQIQEEGGDYGCAEMKVPLGSEVRVPVGRYELIGVTTRGKLHSFRVSREKPCVVALDDRLLGSLVRLSVRIAGEAPWGCNVTCRREGDDSKAPLSLRPQLPTAFPCVLTPGVYSMEVPSGPVARGARRVVLAAGRQDVELTFPK